MRRACNGIGGDIHTCQVNAVCHLELQGDLQRLVCGENAVAGVDHVHNENTGDSLEAFCTLFGVSNAQVLEISGHRGDAIDQTAVFSNVVQKSQLVHVIIEEAAYEGNVLIVYVINGQGHGHKACLVGLHVKNPIKLCVSRIGANQCLQFSLQFLNGIGSGCKHRAANGSNQSQNQKGYKCLFHISLFLSEKKIIQLLNDIILFAVCK